MSITRPLDVAFRESPLLRKVFINLPNSVAESPRTIEEVLLVLDVVVNTTPARNVVPVCFGELVGDRVDDRFVFCAAFYHQTVAPWEYRCGRELEWRRPTDQHRAMHAALKDELTLLWDVVKHQDYSQEKAKARAEARRRTANALVALTSVTRGRLPHATRAAMSVIGDAVGRALESQETQLVALKQEERALSRHNDGTTQAGAAQQGLRERNHIASARQRVKHGFDEIRDKSAALLTEMTRAVLSSKGGGGAKRRVHAPDARVTRSAIRRTRSGQVSWRRV